MLAAISIITTTQKSTAKFHNIPKRKTLHCLISRFYVFNYSYKNSMYSWQQSNKQWNKNIIIGPLPPPFTLPWNKQCEQFNVHTFTRNMWAHTHTHTHLYYSEACMISDRGILWVLLKLHGGLLLLLSAQNPFSLVLVLQANFPLGEYALCSPLQFTQFK